MAGYQGTPSHPAVPQPAAPDSVAICLRCLSTQNAVPRVYCGRIDSSKRVKRHQEGDVPDCTEFHLPSSAPFVAFCHPLLLSDL